MQPSVASVATLKISRLRSKIESIKKWKASFISPRYQTDLQPYTTNAEDAVGNLQTLRAKNK